MRAAREAFNIPLSEAQRANERLLKLTIFPEHHWPIYLNPDEDDAPDGGDGPIRLKRLAQFEVWAAAKIKTGEKRAAVEEAIQAVEVLAAEALACASRERELAEAHAREAEAASAKLEHALSMSKLKIACAEQVQRIKTRARIEVDAVRTWGLDHASRPPRAVYDMRGPMP